MDRRVLFATLILFAGGATGVGVALFAFVGIDEGSIDTEIVWETDPVEGDDGSGAVIASMDGDSVVLQSTVENGERAVRATTVGGDVEWTTPLADAGLDAPSDDPTAISALVTGTLGGDPAVAFTTEFGSLVVLDVADGSERFTIDLNGSGEADASEASAPLQPATGDLTDDGRTEIAAVATDGTVFVVDEGGDEVFETALDEPADRRPLIIESGDETNGGLAVATVTGDGNYTLSLLDEGGDARWTTTPSVTPLSWSAADTRRGPVLALGGTNGNLETIEAEDGSQRYEVGLQDFPVTVGDAGPGQIHVGGAGSVWAVDLLDGEVAWKQQYGGQTRVNAPGVGNVATDGTAGPVAVNRDGNVLVMTRTGEVAARGGVGSAVVYAGPLFADLTGDGSDEVVVVTEDGRIVALAR